MAQITRGVVAALVLQHACGFAPIQRARNPTRRRLGNSREQAAARPGKPDESDAIDVPFTSVPLGNYKSGSILGAVRAGQEEAAQASVGAPVGVGVLRVEPEEKTGFAAKLGEIFNPGGLPDEEPEFPTDKVANSRATVFVIPRKISQWYIYGMFGFEFLAGATAGTPAYQLRHHWIYPSFLLAAVFDHVGRAAKLGKLAMPESKLLNFAVLGDCALCAAASTLANANWAQAAVLGPAFSLAQLPISVLLFFALPCGQALWWTRKEGARVGEPLVSAGLSALKAVLLGRSGKSEAGGNKAAKEVVDAQVISKAEAEAKGGGAADESSEAATKEGQGTELLSTVYLVLAFEAFLTAFTKPATLPLIRAAVMLILHSKIKENDPIKFASSDFGRLTNGLQFASIGTLVMSSGFFSPEWLLKSLPAIAAVIASAKASDLHKNARKETRENGGYLGPW